VKQQVNKLEVVDNATEHRFFIISPDKLQAKLLQACLDSALPVTSRGLSRG
jgi:hypothetical protein